jgi:hypothetical protein
MEARGAGAYAVFPKGDRAPFTDRITPDFITITKTNESRELAPALICFTYETSGRVIGDDSTGEQTPFFEEWEIPFSIVRSVKFFPGGPQAGGKK